MSNLYPISIRPYSLVDKAGWEQLYSRRRRRNVKPEQISCRQPPVTLSMFVLDFDLQNDPNLSASPERGSMNTASAGTVHWGAGAHSGGRGGGWTSN